MGFRIPKPRIPHSTTKIFWMTESRLPYMGRIVLFHPRPQAQGAFPSVLGTRLVLFLKGKRFISTSKVVDPHFSKVPVTLEFKYSSVISFPALKISHSPVKLFFHFCLYLLIPICRIMENEYSMYFDLPPYLCRMTHVRLVQKQVQD